MNPYIRFNKYWWRYLWQSIIDFPGDIVWKIRRLIDWFPVIWRNAEFDNSFLYPILLKKIGRMRKYGHLDWDKGRRYKALIICENLLKRLDADVYGDWYEDYRKMTSDQHRRRFKHEEYMRQRDLDLLFSLMAKWSQTWWD